MDFLTTIQGYLTAFFHWLAELFTKDQWAAFVSELAREGFQLILIIVGTVIVTQITKVFWRRLPIPGDERKGLVRLVTCLIGLGLGGALWPAGAYVPWWFAGFFLGGGGALLVWMLAWPVFATRWPSVADKINATEKENGDDLN